MRTILISTYTFILVVIFAASLLNSVVSIHFDHYVDIIPESAIIIT